MLNLCNKRFNSGKHENPPKDGSPQTGNNGQKSNKNQLKLSSSVSYKLCQLTKTVKKKHNAVFFINITKHLRERISNTFTANSLDDSCFYGNSKRLVKVQEIITLFKWDNKVDFPLYYSAGKFSKLEILEQSSRNSGVDSLLTACWMGSAGSYHWSQRPRQPGALRGTGAGVGKRRTLQLVSLVEKKRDDSTVRNKQNIQKEQKKWFNWFNFGVNEQRLSHFITADQSSKKSPT